MRKSDFSTRPDLFGRSNYLVRELLALYEQSFHTAPGSMAELEEYWQTNAALVGERLGLPAADLPGNQAIVSDNDTFSLLGGTFTASVQNNDVEWSLQGSRGVVQDGATFPVDGGEVTVSVSGNTVSMSFTPDDDGGDGGGD